MQLYNSNILVQPTQQVYHRLETALKPNAQDSVFQNINEYNTSGSFLVIGSQSFQDPTTKFLNDIETSKISSYDQDHGLKR